MVEEPFVFNPTHSTYWVSFLELLSIERWYSFFERMGIPAAFACEPHKILSQVKNTLTAINTGQYKEFGPIQRSQMAFIENIFYQIELNYDQQTAITLYKWVVDHFIDVNTQNRLANWSVLFRRLCDTCKDKYFIEPTINREILNQICNIITLHLDYSLYQAIETEIGEAKIPPPTPWELQLRAFRQRSVGDEPILDPTEVAGYEVSLSINQNEAFLTWEALKKVLSVEQQAALVAWGYKQAKAEDLYVISL